MFAARLKSLLLFFGLACATLGWAAPVATVGQIVMAVGDARRIDPQGNTSSLRTGTPVAEGDRILTGTDAVAIIVFIDNARVSLRADSELHIKQYKIDPAGANTRLDLALLRGAIRQISGQAARNQPESYRLNTPIATIGVRGTDFLTKISSASVETFVQEGQIVVLPAITACTGLPQTGSCAPLAAMAATDTARYLRVLAGGQIEKRVVAAEEIERLFGISLAKASVTTQPDRTAAQANAAPAATAQKATPQASESTHDIRVPDTLGVTQVALTPAPEVTPQPGPPTAEAVPPPVAEVVVSQPIAPDLTRQLVWGKFSSADSLPLQMLATYDQAKAGRAVTVGELGQYGLWRTKESPVYKPVRQGPVQFDLHVGQAYFQQGGKQAPAVLTNPALAINFDSATFTTSLTLAQAQAGTVNMQAAGKINDEGLFLAIAPGQRVAGALSADGQEAGYLFSKDAANGVFKGITLWNAR